MFWKRIKLFNNWSIATRLSLLYIFSSFIMLLMFSLYAYWALTDTLSNENEKFLQDEIRVIRNILSKHPKNNNLLTQELEWAPAELEATEYHYYARISDPVSKKAYAQTQGMSNIFNQVAFPTPANLNEVPEETELWNDKDGNVYLLISALSKVGDTGSMKLIEIALDVTSQQTIIASYRRNLFIVLLLGIACATVLAILITRKGMRSLTEITQYAEKISISQLHSMTINNCPPELQKLVSALNSMLQRIEDAFKRLTLFSQELAHELRTPINNLMGEAAIALSKDRTAIEYKEIITSSIEEYERLSRMIENILFLARTENPSMKIALTKVRLDEEFQKIAENFDPLLQENEIELIIKNKETVVAEPSLLRRALNNLISNAIRYTPHKGKISLGCARVDNSILISVKDNGIGINKIHLPYVCNRFYRINQDNFLNEHGLGLGLAIVSSIMDLHDGKMDICSQVGQGTTINLSFPYSNTQI